MGSFPLMASHVGLTNPCHLGIGVCKACNLTKLGSLAVPGVFQAHVSMVNGFFGRCQLPSIHYLMIIDDWYPDRPK